MVSGVAQGIVYNMGVCVVATWQIRLRASAIGGGDGACSQITLGQFLIDCCCTSAYVVASSKSHRDFLIINDYSALILGSGRDGSTYTSTRLQQSHDSVSEYRGNE